MGDCALLFPHQVSVVHTTMGLTCLELAIYYTHLLYLPPRAKPAKSTEMQLTKTRIALARAVHKRRLSRLFDYTQ